MTLPTETIEDRAREVAGRLRAYKFWLSRYADKTSFQPRDRFVADVMWEFYEAEIALDRISRGEGKAKAETLREAALISKNWHRIPGAFNRHPADEVADAILARAAEYDKQADGEMGQ